MKITFPLNFFKYLPIKSLVLYWICSWLGPWMGGCSSCSYDRGKKLSLYFSGYFVAYIPIFDIFPRTPWQFNIAIEHGHSYSWFCLLKMVMFNSYVSVDQRVYKSPYFDEYRWPPKGPQLALTTFSESLWLIFPENLHYIHRKKLVKSSSSVISPLYPGWWFQPLWKIWKSMGRMTSHISWKIKKKCLKPPTSIPWYVQFNF